MTQEAKAKRYEQTLERAREAKQSTESAVTIGILEEIFPELKESEDEKIRKALIEYFDDMNKANSGVNGFHPRNILAWLEKQGTSYTKRDVDDAYVEGMAFAKDELEKQKPAWSEEDEVKINRIVACLENLISQTMIYYLKMLIGSNHLNKE